MNSKNRIKYLIICGLLAGISTVAFAACNKKSDNSSGESVSSSTASAGDSQNESSSGDSSDTSSVSDSSQAENIQGDKIKKAYEYFNGKEYSFQERITDKNGKAVVITETRKGDDFCVLKETTTGKSGKIKVGDESYDFDMECGIYKKNNGDSPESMIKSVVEKNLPQTSTHIDQEDASKYDVEEYTYTGSTYITVMDFCFDKKNGNLVKYNVTYQIEGKDDETEVRSFVYRKEKADESLLKTDFIKSLTDFESLEGDKRADFCRIIIDKKNISSDDMVKKGMTTDKLRTISYDDFTKFVYECENVEK